MLADHFVEVSEVRRRASAWSGEVIRTDLIPHSLLPPLEKTSFEKSSSKRSPKSWETMKRKCERLLLGKYLVSENVTRIVQARL